MNNQEDSGNNGSSLNFWPIILIFLTAVGVIPNIDYLKSSRPSENEWTKHSPKIGTNDRLWEDPLAVAARYEATINKEKETKSFKPVTEKNILRTVTTDLLEKLAMQDEGSNTFNVLYIFLPEGGFIEDAELRRRFRYAVISALFSSCLVPEHSGDLQFFKSSFNEQPIFIPYELYDFGHSSSHCSEIEKLAKTIVVWLREDLASSESIRFFLDSPINSKIKYAPKFIGPIQSSKLKGIYNELKNTDLPTSKKPKPLLISPFATNSFDDKHNDKTTSFAEKLDEEINKKPIPPIIPTIGTDTLLAATLVWELHERGINNCEDELILISEIDSDYALPLTNHIESGFSHDCTRVVHRYNYMRGIDGQTPSTDNKKDTPSNKSNSGHTPKNLRDYFDASTFEYAEGTDQYDYLLRLIQEIKNLDSIRKVKAIGIIGNDVYDKLLILRALNSAFYNKLFFTTDLDARFLHSEEKKWTRNLIVASNFGFTLRPELQLAAPPFRDGYQTSLYFSTLLALQTNEEWQENLVNWLQPRVFEIGNSDAIAIPRSPTRVTLQNHFSGKENIESYRVENNHCTLKHLSQCSYIHLSDTEKEKRLRNIISGLLGNNHSSIFPEINDLLINKLKFTFLSEIKYLDILILLVIGTVLCLGIYITNHKEPYKKISPLLICFVIFASIGVAITYYLVVEAKEPISLLEGVSMLPVLLIRCLGLCVVIMMCFMFKEDMRYQMIAITQKFKLKRIGTAETDPTSFTRSTWEAIWDGPHIDFKQYAPQKGVIGIKPIWDIYLQATKCKAMVYWIVLSIFFILLFALILFYVWGFPVFPHRGVYAEHINHILLLSSILILWILVFWGGYEARIVTRIINLFRESNDHRDLEEIDQTVDQNKQDSGLSQKVDEKKLQSSYLNFQFIAALSERIGKLIFLPFAMIFFLVIARNELFEKLDFPFSLILLSFLAISYVLFTFYLVRSNAVKLRDDLLNQCQIALSHDPKPDQIESINQLINSINTTKKGVYASFTQRPAIQAFLLPLSGLGGNELINYLMNFF
ncbi:MAG TPA: hypothetical protein PKD35_07545 [Nitrosomonas sp.]|nr:hypothetical protein [Nitrosomonas sp.]